MTPQQMEWAVFLGLMTAVICTGQTFWILKVSRDDRRWVHRAAFSVVFIGTFGVLMIWMALEELSYWVVGVPLWGFVIAKKLLENRGAL